MIGSDLMKPSTPSMTGRSMHGYHLRLDGGDLNYAWPASVARFVAAGGSANDNSHTANLLYCRHGDAASTAPKAYKYSTVPHFDCDAKVIAHAYFW